MADQLLAPAALGLDIDGTLVKSHTAKILPGAERALLDAGVAGVPIFLATNQAGPVWRLVTEDHKYPTAAAVAETLAEVARQVAKFTPSARLFVSTSAGDAPPMYAMSRYTWEEAAERARQDLLAGLLAAGCPLRTEVFTHPACRKPKIGMVERACELIAGPGKLDTWQRGAAVYAGDMETDRALAEAAGLCYLPADEWRAGHLWRLWQPPKPDDPASNPFPLA